MHRQLHPQLIFFRRVGVLQLFAAIWPNSPLGSGGTLQQCIGQKDDVQKGSISSLPSTCSRSQYFDIWTCAHLLLRYSLSGLGSVLFIEGSCCVPGAFGLLQMLLPFACYSGRQLVKKQRQRVICVALRQEVVFPRRFLLRSSCMSVWLDTSLTRGYPARVKVAALSARLSGGSKAMAPRDKDVYFAKLAEQAERYDEMADYMSPGTERKGERGPWFLLSAYTCPCQLHCDCGQLQTAWPF